MDLRRPADVRVLEQGFSPAAVLAAVGEACRSSGGIASFVGQVRAGGGVTALELSHYAPLTVPAMERLAGEVVARWSLDALLVWHRVGLLLPGEPIVLVAAAARHRRAAFEAVDFTMDHLKAAAWFWKREQRAGQWHWIEPRVEDHADLARWR